MCGILGVCRRRPTYNGSITDKEYDAAEKNYFTRMLLQSVQRGSDSTGMFMVNDKNTTEFDRTQNIDVFMLKNHVDSKTFVDDPLYKELLDKVSCQTNFIVGHTRQATSGDYADNKNNHPFICGRIIGVHNGIIQNWKQAAEDNNITLSSECDSEIIFELINHFMETANDLVKSIQLMAEQLKGWMACAFVDTMNPKELILFRRDAPLYIKTTKASNVLAFASDDTYIKNAFSMDCKGPFKVYEATNGLLENNSGVIIKAFGEYQWLEKSKSFSVSI
jgi:glucosamine 6-phosphate synthetase-like amidotransferase/phosphosugar isomerase protein